MNINSSLEIESHGVKKSGKQPHLKHYAYPLSVNYCQALHNIHVY